MPFSAHPLNAVLYVGELLRLSRTLAQNSHPAQLWKDMAVQFWQEIVMSDETCWTTLNSNGKIERSLGVRVGGAVISPGAFSSALDTPLLKSRRCLSLSSDPSAPVPELGRQHWVQVGCLRQWHNHSELPRPTNHSSFQCGFCFSFGLSHVLHVSSQCGFTDGDARAVSFIQLSKNECGRFTFVDFFSALLDAGGLNAGIFRNVHITASPALCTSERP